MSNATPFNRQTSFAVFSAENPGSQQSGVSLDGEFNAVKIALDSTQANFALIQRDDGALANGSVGLEQLDETISLGVTSRGVWLTGTVYTANIETVFNTTKIYRCAITHTSGVFATDLAAGKWVLLADFGVQVLDVNTVGTTNLQNSSVTTAKIAAIAVDGTKIAPAAITLAHLAAALLPYLPPAGQVIAYSGSDEPAGWLRCNGQAVTITYPVLRALYLAEGSPFGVDGGGNPLTPNIMGRQVIGQDAIGGAAAVALVTSAGGSVDALTIGAVGGAQNRTVLQDNLPSYTLPNTLGWAQDTGVGTSNRVALDPAGHETTITAAGAVIVPTNAAYAAQTLTTTTTGHITGSVTSGGSGNAVLTIDPTIVLPFLVKAH